MINCDNTKTMMSDFIEDDIDPAMKDDIDQHLNICPACKALFDKTRKLLKAMSNLATYSVSSDFDLKLQNKINGVAVNSGIGRTNYFIRGAAIGAAAAGLLFVTLDTDEGKLPGEETISKSAVSSNLSPSAAAMIDSSASDSLKSNKDLLNQVDQNLKMVKDRK